MDEARLLPWPSKENGPDHLPPHGGDRQWGGLADEVESMQLATGVEVLSCARSLLAEPTASARELRFTATRLAECLTDTLRVAESRGLRLAKGGQE